MFAFETRPNFIFSLFFSFWSDGQSGQTMFTMCTMHVHECLPICGWLQCIYKFNLKHTIALCAYVYVYVCTELASSRLRYVYVWNVIYSAVHIRKGYGNHKLSGIGITIDTNMVNVVAKPMFVKYCWINHELSTNYCRTIVNSSSHAVHTPHRQTNQWKNGHWS